MDLLQELGPVALGSRLRRLGDTFAADAAHIYGLYGVTLQPRWFPVFHLLCLQEESTITAMARDIGCSHPVVSQAVKEMRRAGLVETAPGRTDGRVNVVRLAKKGRAQVPGMQAQMRDVAVAVERLLGRMRHDLWRAIEELEALLDKEGLYARVRTVRKERAAAAVEIIDYEPRFHEDFRRLNRAWVERYFELEEADNEVLDNPEERVIGPGGCILLARRAGEIVGTAALLRIDATTFELAKMSVSPREQGKGIGRRLATAVLDRARSLGARRVFLESNTRLTPAVSLYSSLGFTPMASQPSPFKRCNIQMELLLTGGASD
ncbi:MAG: GNAT family N-acetyltransferase [Desulfovibrionaceae bacterium]|jgi:GNAT superfamily N-acetyltransferase|nr:GNAT family N-acetyltransferase [Desulfovibrionaceae bacterium]